MRKKQNLETNLKTYLAKKKWKYKEENDQYAINVCPFCGNTKYKFYINQKTSQYNCFVCDESGNIYTLKVKLNDITPIQAATTIKKKPNKSKVKELVSHVDKCHKKLMEFPSDHKVKKYLSEKYRMDSETIKAFRIGYEKKNGIGWLVYPYFSDKMELTNIKYRSLPPADKSFRRIKGLDSTLYNLHNVDTSLNYIILCEGETDTQTMHRLEFKNVLGVTVGARAFKPEWVDFLGQFEHIYILYDPDTVGNEGALKVSKRLGLDKCKKVVVPSLVNEEGEEEFADITKYVKETNSDGKAIKKLLANAELFEVEDILSLKTALNELYNIVSQGQSIEGSGLKTPWDNVNKLIGSFMPGDLIILSGMTKIGKTTFALDLIRSYAMLGIPVLNYCLEMQTNRIVPKLIQNIRLCGKEEISVDDIAVVRALYGKKPMYFAHTPKAEPEHVFDTIREATKRYGLEFVVFDHLHFLVRNAQNLAAEIGMVIRQFKLLAEELRIPIMVIAQPRKLQGRASRMTVHDLKDSSAIPQDADTVIIVHRDRLPEKKDKLASSNIQLFSNTAEIIVEATRYNPGGISNLFFDGARSRYFLDREQRDKMLTSR